MNITAIDADSLLFRCCYGDNITESKMKTRWDTKVELIKNMTWADEVKIALKGTGNFREQLDSEYKAQRPDIDPEFKKRLYFLHNYGLSQGAVRCDGWEADDQVVAWAYEAKQNGDEAVIAGIDKDLLQVVGAHYNYGGTSTKPLKEDERWHHTSVEEGWYRFCKQLLTGDTIDNIKGITQVGEKRAEAALTGLNKKEQMEKVVELYKKEFGEDWERKLHVNCNLIYMRRWPDDEFIWQERMNE